MGKRVKWFTEAECDMIRTGSTFYISNFSLDHEEAFCTIKNRTDLIEMYRTLENRRLLDIKIKSGSARSLLTVSFQCP
jgi:hypothetical protein